MPERRTPRTKNSIQLLNYSPLLLLHLLLPPRPAGFRGRKKNNIGYVAHSSYTPPADGGRSLPFIIVTRSIRFRECNETFRKSDGRRTHERERKCRYCVFISASLPHFRGQSHKFIKSIDDREYRYRGVLLSQLQQTSNGQECRYFYVEN